jgi:DNA-binding CsgD family transcriptional regulator
VYVILITVWALMLQGVNTLILALVAVLGLVIFWLFSRLELRKLEKKFYQQEISSYMEILSSEPRNDYNEVKALDSGSSVTLPLTQRELEIIMQMAAGKTNKEIAFALSRSEQTVKNHISNIFLKLDVNDRTSAVLLALHYGWLKDDHFYKSKRTQLSLP